MTKVFFNYVWWPPGNPAWPLTFATKAAQSHVRKVLAEGDLVFAVRTKGKHTTPEDFWRMLGAFKVPNLKINTENNGIPTCHRQNPSQQHPRSASSCAEG